MALSGYIMGETHNGIWGKVNTGVQTMHIYIYISLDPWIFLALDAVLSLDQGNYQFGCSLSV